MAEYIEREALLKHKTLIPGFIGEYVLVDRITEAPAADVVPVIIDKLLLQRTIEALEGLHGAYKQVKLELDTKERELKAMKAASCYCLSCKNKCKGCQYYEWGDTD